MADLQQEYTAARTVAAVFDLNGWTQVELAGSDRAKFLHNFCTNDIRALAPGAGCEAFITNVQGKVLAHVFVYAGESTLDLVGAPGPAERIVKHLSRYQINEDVTFSDRTGTRGLLLVAGPQSPAILERAGIGGLSLAPGQHTWVSTGDTNVHVARNELLRMPGFLLFSPAAQTGALCDKLADAGATRAGPAVFDALRIEAAFPLYGVDITDANFAQEAGRTAQAISFSKGCYLGQEPIARIDALGHVNQVLRGIRLQEGPVPPAGTEIIKSEADPRKIGQITSSALSFGTGLPVVLGYLKRNFDTPGLEVVVTVEGRLIAGELYWPV